MCQVGANGAIKQDGSTSAQLPPGIQFTLSASPSPPSSSGSSQVSMISLVASLLLLFFLTVTSMSGLPMSAGIGVHEIKVPLTCCAVTAWCAAARHSLQRAAAKLRRLIWGRCQLIARLQRPQRGRLQPGRQRAHAAGLQRRPAQMRAAGRQRCGPAVPALSRQVRSQMTAGVVRNLY